MDSDELSSSEPSGTFGRLDEEKSSGLGGSDSSSDDDFMFEESFDKTKKESKAEGKTTQSIKNQAYDEALDLSASSIQSEATPAATGKSTSMASPANFKTSPLFLAMMPTALV